MVIMHPEKLVVLLDEHRTLIRDNTKIIDQHY